MRDMQWLSQQVQGGLPTEEIDGILCHVIGERVVPVGAAGMPVYVQEAHNLAAVVHGVYHQPGCRHGDQGQDSFVTVLQALAAGAVSCTSLGRIPPRLQRPPDQCEQCGSELDTRERRRGRCDRCQEAALRAA